MVMVHSIEEATVVRMARLTDAEFDALPFGAIRLDEQGQVLAYNAREAASARRERSQVVGRNFWREIAPCADVDAFRGRLDALGRRGCGTDAFDFELALPWGKRSVRVRLMVERAVRWVFVSEMD